MIILEIESAILRNLLERSLDANEKLSGDYWFCDFDGVRFHVRVPSKEKHGYTVEMMISCTPQLNEYGGEETYEELYGPYKT